MEWQEGNKMIKTTREIERKFTVWRKLLPSLTNGNKIRQGYLSFQDPMRRIRLTELYDGKKLASIDEKQRSSVSNGPLDAQETNEEVAFDEAERRLIECKGCLISKIRYKIWFEGKLWEIDVFSAENYGLTIAEIELESRDELFVLPSWVSAEVTRDLKYLNSNLAQYPFCKWTAEEQEPALR